MGTRGLICITKGREIKLAQYNQFDSYPSGLGIDVLHWLRELDINKYNKFKENLKYIKNLTNEEIKEYWKDIGVDVEKEKFVPMDVSEKFMKLHPTLERTYGAEILNTIINAENTIEVSNYENFAYDSLFCEWGYIIDIENDTFEVYKGFVREKLSEDERFYKDKPDKNGYYGIKLIKKYNIKDLPNDATFANIEDEEEMEEDEEELSWEVVTAYKCPKCGRIVEVKENYCPECGIKLS
jgi:hypothetical protein